MDAGNVCENMLTHVHKVIHLVVDTFEQGLETSPVLFTEKTKVTVSDRTLVSVGPACPISGNSERAVSVFDRTLALKVTGRWQGAFGQCRRTLTWGVQRRR